MNFKIILKNKYIKNSRAFTVIETLISLAIFTLILGLITLFARDTIYYRSIFFSGLTGSDDARHILQPISNEIRSASQSSLGSYPLEVTGDNAFVFYTDTNNDGLKERVRYFLNGTTFSKGVIKPTGNPLTYAINNEVVTPLMYNIVSGATPIFSYYDTNYTGTTSAMVQPVSPLDVRLIKITLTIDADPSRPPLPFTVTTQISFRNLKDNL